MSMKERLAALERIAAEKKKREMQAIADHKAAMEEKKTAPKSNNAAFVGKAFDYVPPPPKGAATIQPPPKGNVKTFKISTGECPWMMSLPGITTGVKPEMPEGVEETVEPVDDGLSPEEKRKMELE